MHSNSTQSEEELAHKLSELNSYYACGTELMRSALTSEQSLHASGELNQLMTRIRETEQSIAFRTAEVQQLIKSRPRLQQAMEQQQHLLSELITLVGDAESRLVRRRDTLAPELDQNAIHLSMRSAYHKNR